MKAIALLHTPEGVFLMTAKDGDTYNVLGFDSVQKGLDFFTNGYNRFHDRGYEASMSACVNFISFQPKVVGFEDFDALMDELVDKSSLTLVRIGNIAGSYEVIPCKPEAVRVYEERGVTPQLITEKEQPSPQCPPPC